MSFIFCRLEKLINYFFSSLERVLSD